MSFTSLQCFAALIVTALTVNAESCHHGWIKRGSSCYAFVTGAPDTWTEAMAFCTGISAKLVEIETAAENDFLRLHLIDRGTNDSFWIGLTDTIFEGEWLWMSSQSTPVYKDWSPGQPNNYQQNENCAHLYKPFSFHWNDFPCAAKQSFICEKELDLDIGIVG
ncbi:galactose-specific lectin nattectin-like [Ostrea edulis]|uniref:galactose-specific lectin nattectin-like n=1 Tax=Ostrea edulis TaxID=37623 RepID=UPI0024AFEDCB|nr:galactose-specific lectin nattectin-like [Ostrea edulis]